MSAFSKLIKLQKNIFRVIDQAGYMDHSGPIFKKYNTLKFPDLMKSSQIIALLPHLLLFIWEDFIKSGNFSMLYFLKIVPE